MSHEKVTKHKGASKRQTKGDISPDFAYFVSNNQYFDITKNNPQFNVFRSVQSLFSQFCDSHFFRDIWHGVSYVN